MRKPVPGCNQLILAEDDGWAKPEDPFVRFLKAGRPVGPWMLPVIDTASPVGVDSIDPTRIALHLHAFYVEELQAVLKRLRRNVIRPTLFVSTGDGKEARVQSALDDYSGPVGEIRAVPNHGRDIAPLLTLFGPTLVQEFDIFGHLHTKRSLHATNRRTIDAWTSFLMENLLGGESGGAMSDRILTAMTEDPTLGIVYPDDPNILEWTENLGPAQNVAEQMYITHLHNHFSFPMGNMLWARSTYLDRFVTLGLCWEDYPAEPLPIDGTSLHAIERLLGALLKRIGFGKAVTNVGGVTR